MALDLTNLHTTALKLDYRDRCIGYYSKITIHSSYTCFNRLIAPNHKLVICSTNWWTSQYNRKTMRLQMTRELHKPGTLLFAISETPTCFMWHDVIPSVPPSGQAAASSPSRQPPYLWPPVTTATPHCFMTEWARTREEKTSFLTTAFLMALTDWSPWPLSRRFCNWQDSFRCWHPDKWQLDMTKMRPIKILRITWFTKTAPTHLMWVEPTGAPLRWVKGKLI